MVGFSVISDTGKEEGWKMTKNKLIDEKSCG